MARLLSAPLIAWLSRLSYPRMFLVMATLFGINLLIPDPIILVDEILLGLATMMLAKRKRAPKSDTADSRGAPIDGDARRF